MYGLSLIQPCTVKNCGKFTCIFHAGIMDATIVTKIHM